MATLRERVRWSLREGVVIAAILVAWLIVGALVAFPFELLQEVFRLRIAFPVYELPIFAVAQANVALYVVVRAGTLLIDHYRGDEEVLG